jgi:hypothetical protein
MNLEKNSVKQLSSQILQFLPNTAVKQSIAIWALFYRGAILSKNSCEKSKICLGDA